jgi:hypothetical protein
LCSLFSGEIYAVVLAKKSILLFSIAIGLLLPACANAPWASSLERSLGRDPSLENGSVFGSSDSTGQESDSSSPEAGLPVNFPAEIPRYPNAEFLTTTPAESLPDLSSGETPATETRWSSADSSGQIQQFYRDALTQDGWQLVEPAPNPPSPTANAPTASPDAADASRPLIAERDGLRVEIAIPSQANSTAEADNTEFTIGYQFTNDVTTAASPTPSPTVGSNTTSGGASDNGSTPSTTLTAPEFTDLAQAPMELQSYIADLSKLGALRVPTTNANGSSTTEFRPNTSITRREYARWLVTANNLIYANQPARRIRLGVSSDQPAFQDVPTSDPDFGEIQGLANAGLIASPLSGDSTTVTFRPDAPLTREDLLLWKVPVDLRKALPDATVAAVQQTWGFQDAAQIDARALRAILADFQNGDQSNIRRAFGYTTLFQPDKPATRAEAAAVLWFFGSQGDGVSAQSVLQPGQQGG